MTIGQVARNQQMLYSIANRNVSSGAEDYGDNIFSSPAALKGTVRQIAKRLYDASFSSGAIAGESGVSSTQGVYPAGVNVWA